MTNLPDPLDAPVRRGLRFLHVENPDEIAEVTDVRGGVVTWADSMGEHADEEAWFPGDVLVLAPAPDPPAVPAPVPGEDGTPQSPQEAVLQALDAAVVAQIEDSLGIYSGQPLPSAGGYTMIPSDDFLREQINQFLDSGVIDFREARRLLGLLGDELQPVVRADDLD